MGPVPRCHFGACAGRRRESWQRASVRAKLAQIVGDYSGWIWLNESSAQGIKPRSIERLNEVSTPTLVIVGKREIVDFQTIADTLARGIRRARKVVIEGAGHMSNMENAEEFNSVLFSFLDDVEAALRSSFWS